MNARVCGLCFQKSAGIVREFLSLWALCLNFSRVSFTAKGAKVAKHGGKLVMVSFLQRCNCVSNGSRKQTASRSFGSFPLLFYVLGSLAEKITRTAASTVRVTLWREQ